MMERTTGGRTGPSGNRCHFGGALQRKENAKIPSLLGKWVGGSRSHSEFFFKSSQNSSKPVLIFWSSVPCVFCLYNIIHCYKLLVIMI